MLPKEVIDLMNETTRKLEQYEFSEELWEFLCDPQAIALEENLSQEEIESLWDEIAEGFMSTPVWCIEARAAHTLSVSDPGLTFTQLTRRLRGQHKAKFDACFLAKCNMSDA